MPLSSAPRSIPQGLKAHHHDIDSARAWMADICGPHSLQASADRHLDFEHSANRLSALSTVVGRIQYGTEVVIGVDAGSALRSYSISLPLDGEQALQQGRQMLHSDPRVGLIVSPFEHQRLSIAANCQKLQVVITCTSMNQVLEQLLQRPVDQPIAFQTRIDAQEGASAAWWRMVRYVVDEMDQPVTLLGQLPLARDLERTLIKGLILSQPSNYSAELQACSESRSPAFILKARRFIELHAEQDVQLADIRQAAGVSPQRLHDGFKQHFGLSPLAYLKRFRLESVRRSLLEGPGHDTVATTALRWGFNHLGRFAGEYQQAFGERPSHTLARRR